jgi:hypothetical protein
MSDVENGNITTSQALKAATTTIANRTLVSEQTVTVKHPDGMSTTMTRKHYSDGTIEEIPIPDAPATLLHGGELQGQGVAVQGQGAASHGQGMALQAGVVVPLAVPPPKRPKNGGQKCLIIATSITGLLTVIFTVLIFIFPLFLIIAPISAVVLSILGIIMCATGSCCCQN